MEGEYGIEELKDAVRLGAALAKASYNAGKDGWQWTDYMHFLPVVPYIAPALEGATEIPAEVADLDVSELEELAKMVMDEFNIGEGDVKEFIGNALSAASSIIKVIQIGIKWWG